jgi:hypothetical protein
MGAGHARPAPKITLEAGAPLARPTLRVTASRPARRTLPRLPSLGHSGPCFFFCRCRQRSP